MANFIVRRCLTFSENFIMGRLFTASSSKRFTNSTHAVAQMCGKSRDTALPEAPPLEEQRLLRTVIIGTPNVGKSTLVNQLLGHKLFAVSPKVHTTIRKAMGVLTENNAQVILLDTPGVVPYQYGRKLHLPRSFLTDPSESLMEADLIVVMVDVTSKNTREHIHPQIMASLQQYSHIPSVLVLNKVDALKHKHVLLFVAEALTGSLETQRKMRQVRALRGKLRDGTIRGRKARQAAILELEKLKKELNISSDEEIHSKIDSRGSADDDDGGRLHDSEDECLQESQSFSTSSSDLEEEEELSLPSTEGSLMDSCDTRVLPKDARLGTEPGRSEITGSPISLTNQSDATTGGLSSSDDDDDKYLSDSEAAPLLSHDEGSTRGVEPSSDGAASPPDRLYEDETQIGGLTSPGLQEETATTTTTAVTAVGGRSSSWPHFDRIFMISALTGDGVDDLRSYLLSSAVQRPWEYQSTDITDQSSLSLVEDIIRERMYHHYDLELPYITKQENVIWEWNDDKTELSIYQNLICQKRSQASILIGPRGGTIQTLTAEATEDIEKLLKCTVDLVIHVKSSKK